MQSSDHVAQCRLLRVIKIEHAVLPIQSANSVATPTQSSDHVTSFMRSVEQMTISVNGTTVFVPWKPNSSKALLPVYGPYFDGDHVTSCPNIRYSLGNIIYSLENLDIGQEITCSTSKLPVKTHD